MRDVELFVRYVAFQYSLATYTGNLKTFLDDECKRLNSRWATDESDIRRKAEEMEAAISTSYDIFGDNAFRKYDGHNYETRFNRAVFDILTYYFADEALRKSALAKKAKVKSAYEALSTNGSFIKSVETTTKSVDATRIRFVTWGQTLGKALGVKVTIPSIGKA
jgi:hypothetical protein